MDLFFVLLPALLIVLLYGIIFTHKGEPQRVKRNLKSYDWITNLSVIFGCIALLNGLEAMGIVISQKWAIAINVIFLALLIIAVIYRIRKGKPVTRYADDERTNQIYAKSSRNALFITYLGLIIIMGSEANLLATKWIVAILGAGLITLFGSIFFYYYRKS